MCELYKWNPYLYSLVCCLLHHLTFFFPFWYMYFQISELLMYAGSFCRNLCWKLKRLLKGIVNHLKKDNLVILFPLKFICFLYFLVSTWILHKFQSVLSGICFAVAHNVNTCQIVNILHEEVLKWNNSWCRYILMTSQFILFVQRKLPPLSLAQ